MGSLPDETEALYREAIRSTRGGPLFNAFPYPTKISPETIGLFIAVHTSPGDTVFDGFAGSGTTGLGALLCANPTQGMQREAFRLGLPANWGPRRAVLYEIGVLGTFVSRTLCSPPNPEAFADTAEKLIRQVEARYGWLYGARDPSGKTGRIRYVVWSDELCCPSCGKQSSLWEVCVSRNPAEISSAFQCPACQKTASLGDAGRVMETVSDDLLDEDRKVRRRRLAWVYGSTGKQTWSRPPQPSDLRLLKRVEEESVAGCVPKTAIPWGDLYRSGYHEGITHLHHFYTRRNLIAFAALWEQVRQHPAEMRDVLRFWLLSYNAAHTTIMTRVVAKKGQSDLVVTSAQPGVLYVSGLPVEKNIFAGLRRKLRTILRAFRTTHACEGEVEVHNESSLATGLADASVDYVFTDPPFGGNIPYAEVNFLNESWLGHTTDATEEVVVSPHQGKAVDDYERLLLCAFREAYRVLRPKGKATVVFHSTSARVWNALQQACEKAGFGVADASVLDKTQGSFKQVTTNGNVRGDPLVLLTKALNCGNGKAEGVWAVADGLVQQAAVSKDSAETTPQRLYSRLVAHYLAHQQRVPIDAGEFYRQLAERWAVHGNAAP